MERLGGLLMLFGMVLLLMGGYRLLTDGPDIGATFGTGIFFVAVGWFLAVRSDKGSVTSDLADKVEDVAARASDMVETVISTKVEPPKEAIFSVIQTGDDDVLDKVERLLERDPRIRTVVSEGGRWYSVPDRDDLPGWYALRAYCREDEVDQVMEDTSRDVLEKLGEAAAASVSISRYT